MGEIRNVALERLARGEVILGVGARVVRTTEIAKMMRACGYDWLFIDLEHGQLTLEMVAQISNAAVDNGICPIVRVPTGQYGMASCILDGGAQGIMMPHVENADDAREAVHYLRFPPVGHRATLGGLPQYDYMPVDAEQSAREINASTVIVVMIESPNAAANAEEIAAVEGIDALMVGVNDLAQEMGITGQIGHPDVMAACQKIVDAAAKHGKHVGIGGIRDMDLLQRYIAMGFRFILAGNDFSFMMGAAKAHSDAIRARVSAPA